MEQERLVQLKSIHEDLLGAIELLAEKFNAIDNPELCALFYIEGRLNGFIEWFEFKAKNQLEEVSNDSHNQ